MTKTKTLYEIRIPKRGDVFSASTNFRLYERFRALRIMKRLKRRGYDALIAPVKVAA